MQTEAEFHQQIKTILAGRKMPLRKSYKQFIRSPYWKAVRHFVYTHKGRKCAECGTSENIHVHHTTYQHHGQEHLYWRTDLILLCGLCHLTHHESQRAEMTKPYPAEIINYVKTVDSPPATILTLGVLKREARKKGIKLPQLLKLYIDEGYGWINNDLRSPKKGGIDVLVKLH